MLNRMWFFVIGFLLISCTENTKKEGFLIDGRINGIDSGTLKLSRLDLRTNEPVVVDSAQIENGRFRFTGKVDSPYLYTLSTGEKKLHFFVENTSMRILADFKHFDNAEITGSREDSLFRSYDLDDIFDRKKGMEIMLKYPDYVFGAFTAYYQFQLFNIHADTLEMIVKSFTPEVKRSVYYRHLNNLYQTIKNVAISKPAPGFAIPDMNGNTLHLSDFKGKYVLLDFWASWCAPCRAANPQLRKVYQAFKDRNFTIIGISIDKDRKRWVNAIREDSLNWPNVSNLQGWDSVSTSYGVKAVPQNFLLDPQGIIIDKNIEPEDLMRKLAKFTSEDR